MFGWFRRHVPEEISRIEPGFEEGEHRTPWTGVVLLIVMFVAGLSFGWRALDDLARVPSRPPDLSYCSERFRTADSYQDVGVSSPIAAPVPQLATPYGVTQEPPCNWSDLETKHGLPALDDQRRSILNEINNQSTTEKDDLAKAQAKRQQLETEYNQRLQEIQARVPTITQTDLDTLQKNLQAARDDEARLTAIVQQQNTDAAAQSDQLKTVDRQMAAAYQSVFAEQDQRLRWYELQVFLLQLFFMLPLFLLALRAYVNQLRRNSPYAIILTAVVAVAGVLLLRVILNWFWDLFLAHVLQVLWQWIQNFEILRSVVFYLGMVLSFVIFGGAVYYLQKRIFDPRRVAIRRFRLNQCPQCQTTLDLAVNYCPNCGHHVRDRCPTCNNLRLAELPYCPHCGNKIS